MKTKIQRIFKESIAVKQDTLEKNLPLILRSIQAIVKALSEHKKIIFFGNGGSAADSQHAAAELVGRFKKERKAIRALALTTNTSTLTALGNDYGYDIIFRRQIEALGDKGDIAFAISTSGNSLNVIEAVKTARRKGLITIALTGDTGGKLAKLAHIAIKASSRDTARIQEAHSCIIHVICELVEEHFSQRK